MVVKSIKIEHLIHKSKWRHNFLSHSSRREINKVSNLVVWWKQSKKPQWVVVESWSSAKSRQNSKCYSTWMRGKIPNSVSVTTYPNHIISSYIIIGLIFHTTTLVAKWVRCHIRYLNNVWLVWPCICDLLDGLDQKML